MPKPMTDERLEEAQRVSGSHAKSGSRKVANLLNEFRAEVDRLREEVLDLNSSIKALSDEADYWESKHTPSDADNLKSLREIAERDF